MNDSGRYAQLHPNRPAPLDGRPSDNRLLTIAEVLRANKILEDCRNVAYDPNRWLGCLAGGTQEFFGAQQASAAFLHRRVAPPEKATPGVRQRTQRTENCCDLTSSEFLRTGTSFDDDAVRECLDRLETPGFKPHEPVISRGGVSPAPGRILGMIGGKETPSCVAVLWQGVRGLNVKIQRRRGLLEYLFRELRQLLGAPLLTLHEPGIGTLPPRVRQVVACILSGYSTKRTAAQLGISTHTVHQYVKDIMQHFQTSTRSELSAYWIARGWRLPVAEYGFSLPIGRSGARCN